MAFGIYVHIPFCSRRCDYCDFATWVGREDLVEEYVNSVVRQLNFQIEHFRIDQGSEVSSIFFGGGTPNLIEEKHISDIISAVANELSISKQTEITVECNPDHVTQNQMDNYFRAGVNRISMGVQSSDQNVLNYLGREHDTEHVLQAREYISASGISNLNADLIYGSPVESLESWNKSLEFLISLDVNHISAYALGVESGTPLGRSISLGEKQTTDEDDLANKYELAEKILSENGFTWYEISNWSQAGRQSVHNLTYWRGGNIIALGCAAHGVHNDIRYSTPRNIEKYLEKVSQLRNPSKLNSDYLIKDKQNSSIGKSEELFALKLRTRDGVSWPLDKESELLKSYIEENFVLENIDNSTIYLDVKGRLMANRITIDLFEEYSKLISGVQ